MQIKDIKNEITNSFPDKLNRFTTLPILLDILIRKALFLPGFSEWEDKNDIEFMKIYSQEQKKDRMDSVRAICFTWDDETIHHWKYFSDGSAGCCIEFDGKKLLSSLENFNAKILHGKVKYYKIKGIPAEIHLDELPFIKRHPYRIESEYRIVCVQENDSTCNIPIELDWINKITFNQEMPISVLETIRKMIKSHSEIEETNHSTVFENKKFIRKISSSITKRL